jgi:hypothetical protein
MDYVIEVHTERDDTEARAVATMEGLLGSYQGQGRAPRNPKVQNKFPVATGLAIARALRSLEVEIMELVHEEIDRYTGDV